MAKKKNKNKNRVNKPVQDNASLTTSTNVDEVSNNETTEVVESREAVVNEAIGGADLSNNNVPVSKNNSKKNAKNANNKDKKPNIFVRIGHSFSNMFSEMKKVTWADGKTVVTSTLVVLGVVFIFFIGLLGIDSGLLALLKLLLNN